MYASALAGEYMKLIGYICALLVFVFACSCMSYNFTLYEWFKVS